MKEERRDENEKKKGGEGEEKNASLFPLHFRRSQSRSSFLARRSQSTVSRGRTLRNTLDDVTWIGSKDAYAYFSFPPCPTTLPRSKHDPSVAA